MKKRNFILCFIFAILFCFLITPKAPETLAFAAETYQITFYENGGTCDTSTLTTNTSGTLDTIPTATKSNCIFVGWSLNDIIITTSTVFSQNETVTAVFAEKTNYYTISVQSDKFKVVGKTSNDNITYTVCENVTNLSDTITQIQSDILNDSPATINFNSISLSENLTISIPSLSITGTIALNSYQLSYAPTASTTLNLTNLTTSSSENQNQIEIGSNVTSLTVSKCAFNSTQNQSNYAIKLNNSLNLTFLNSLSHSTAYLFNYVSNLYTVFDISINLSSQANNKISLTIPYFTDYEPVINDCAGLKENNFNLCPEQNFYTAAIHFINGIKLFAKTFINFNFDANGGEISSNYQTTSISYKSNSEEYFPKNTASSTEISKEHYDFLGFVGKITFDSATVTANSLSSATWYYDKAALSSFISGGSVLSSVSAYFYSTIPTQNIQPFTYYKYDSTDTDCNFLAAKFNITHNQSPTFVACWSKTQYTISFEENGGEDVANITKTYGETITSLPATTKTGYDFENWYFESTLENKATIEDISTMPDTNPTLYAKWTPHKNLLTIYQNNGSENINQNTDYNTDLTTLSSIANISKTGHSFVGWFANEQLTTPITLSTMPDSPLAIYAKWQVNQYTISLYYNHSTNSALFKTTTQDYATDISNLKAQNPEIEGFHLRGWFTDTNGQYQYDLDSLTAMPAENLTLYAYWTPINYSLIYYYNTTILSSRNNMHYGDTITTPDNPTLSGYKFVNWFSDRNLTEQFNLQTMPSHDVSVYAKFTEKDSLFIDKTTQTYQKSQNKYFNTGLEIDNLVVEYLVNESWTTTVPTAIGFYNVKITRNEDAQYKAYSEIIENGLRITADEMDLSAATLILFGIAIVEIILSIIILIMQKHKKTYINYMIILPFGIIDNSSFVKFLIALALAVFGLVLMIIQLVKLHKVGEDYAKQIDKEKDNTPKDFSQNESISKNVDNYLKEKGFINEQKETDE